MFGTNNDLFLVAVNNSVGDLIDYYEVVPGFLVTHGSSFPGPSEYITAVSQFVSAIFGFSRQVRVSGMGGFKISGANVQLFTKKSEHFEVIFIAEPSYPLSDLSELSGHLLQEIELCVTMDRGARSVQDVIGDAVHHVLDIQI